MGLLEFRAQDFATAAHGRIHHVRKYTGLPYWHHPQAVAELVRGVPHTEAMLAAAWLHDTVEDTGVSLADIRETFGEEVATLVGSLTDVSKPGDGNRAVRKTMDRAHLAEAPPEAKTVKLADLIDNGRSIASHDAKFAAVYFEEKRQLLPVLKSGDPGLWDLAHRLVDDYYEVFATLAPLRGEDGAMAEWVGKESWLDRKRKRLL